jgi:hypothetical protein
MAGGAVAEALWVRVSDLVRTAEDPHAELLALVWGSRFDSEHALGLLRAGAATANGAALALVATAASTFDQLAPQRQQRLRRLILRHRTRWDNRRHGPHSAD